MDLGLDVVDGVRRLHLEGDGLTRDCRARKENRGGLVSRGERVGVQWTSRRPYRDASGGSGETSAKRVGGRCRSRLARRVSATRRPLDPRNRSAPRRREKTPRPEVGDGGRDARATDEMVGHSRVLTKICMVLEVQVRGSRKSVFATRKRTTTPRRRRFYLSAKMARATLGRRNNVWSP